MAVKHGAFGDVPPLKEPDLARGAAAVLTRQQLRLVSYNTASTDTPAALFVLIGIAICGPAGEPGRSMD